MRQRSRREANRRTERENRRLKRVEGERYAEMAVGAGEWPLRREEELWGAESDEETLAEVGKMRGRNGKRE